MTGARTSTTTRRATKLLLDGALAGPLFVSVFVIEGARRPGYKPRRHPVSSLALGHRGWVQTANFTVAGTLYLAGAAGLNRTHNHLLGTRLGPTVFAGVGLGLLGSAGFPTNPVSGYPPGTPNTPNEQTMTMHEIAAMPIFVGIPFAAFACAVRFHRSGNSTWAVYSATTGAAMLTSIGLAGAGFGQASGLVDHAGLLQRTAIITGLGWLTALSGSAFHSSLRHGTRPAT
jgi:Protein of unknown function (DUF998)